MSRVMSQTEPTPGAQAAVRDNASFARLTEPFRREIKVHCYRMLGSLHEAEDLVQETYLRAWRAFDSLEDRGAVRAWLYRIATNACLNALESRKQARRWLPDQQAPAMATAQLWEGGPVVDVPWLEPYPDAELNGIADGAPNPEARYTAREAVQLAFIAAIQELPPRQRATLLLCDVLGWAASEAATLLGGTTASINSALQRARETLGKRQRGHEPAAARPSLAQQRLLERYLKAWEGHDLDGFVALLKEDASFTMPPWAQWYVGRENIRAFTALAWKVLCPALRIVPIAANGQPAFAVYEQSADGRWAARSIHVLTLEGDKIATMTLFVPPTGHLLFPAFGLPPFLPGA